MDEAEFLVVVVMFDRWPNKRYAPLDFLKSVVIDGGQAYYPCNYKCAVRLR
jgi:hypothetical protein